jgi:hypothetical protein
VFASYPVSAGFGLSPFVQGFMCHQNCHQNFATGDGSLDNPRALVGERAGALAIAAGGVLVHVDGAADDPLVMVDPLVVLARGGACLLVSYGQPGCTLTL